MISAIFRRLCAEWPSGEAFQLINWPMCIYRSSKSPANYHEVANTTIIFNLSRIVIDLDCNALDKWNVDEMRFIHCNRFGICVSNEITVIMK